MPPEQATQLTFDGGLVDNPDRSTLTPGELSIATGCEYRVGSPELYKLPGRTRANSSGLGVAILGLERFQYEEAADVFVVLGADGNIYEATPGTSMTFTNKMKGIDMSSGSGLDDATIGGTFSGTNYTTFDVQIDTTGTPDKFRWRKNRGAWTTLVSITGSAQTLADGITITFAATTGHTLGNTWSLTAIPAFNTSAQPQFTSFRDRWVMINGVEMPFIREPDVCPGTGSPWRPLGMQRPLTQPTVANVASPGAGATYPGSNTGDMTSPSLAIDDNSLTYGYMQRVSTSPGTSTHTFTWSTNLAASNRKLVVLFSALGSDSEISTVYDDQRETQFGEGRPRPPQGATTITPAAVASYKIEVKNARSGFTDFITVREWTAVNKIDKLQYAISIDDAVNFSSTNLILRVTITTAAGNPYGSSNQFNLFEAYVFSGRNTPADILYGITYGYTEVYVDSQGARHESAISPISSELLNNDNGATNTYGATLTLPAIPQNPFAQSIAIYRSLDTETGGYPFMYLITEIEIGTTTWVDDYSKSLTNALDKTASYQYLTLVYGDGTVADVEAFTPPPRSTLAAFFSGAMVYIPTKGPHVWYSLPTANFPAWGEAVPTPYYLTFETKQNDSPISMQVTNGGKTLVVYFNAYAMIVNYLPQASDSDRFDQRVREFVSDKRGCVGRLASTTFSPNEGYTVMSAAVDDLGLWVTEGIGGLQDWSRDIDWEGNFGNADLTTAILVDDPQLRRLELIFNSDGAGTWKQFRIYYGEVKQNGQPKWLGPDPIGFRCAAYANVDGEWQGWTGDKSSGGYIFNERVGNEDLADGYNTAGDIPFDAETGDIYPYSLKSSGIISFIYPKFDDNSDADDKNVTLVGSYVIDGRTTSRNKTTTITKSFNLQTSKKKLMRRFADRFRLRIQDISATSLPGLVAAEIMVRELGGKGGVRGE
jgi:hypothetical protein